MLYCKGKESSSVYSQTVPSECSSPLMIFREVIYHKEAEGLPKIIRLLSSKEEVAMHAVVILSDIIVDFKESAVKEGVVSPLCKLVHLYTSVRAS